MHTYFSTQGRRKPFSVYSPIYNILYCMDAVCYYQKYTRQANRILEHQIQQCRGIIEDEPRLNHITSLQSEKKFTHSNNNKNNISIRIQRSLKA